MCSKTMARAIHGSNSGLDGRTYTPHLQRRPRPGMPIEP
jgi:hypothetical protein